MRGYQFKWVCRTCSAIHWFDANYCRRCGGLEIEQQPNGKQRIMPKQDELKLDIDPNRLEDEWKMQPKMYFVWAEKVAEAQAKYDEAKAELDLTKADLHKQIKTDPESFGLSSKPNIPDVDNCIEMQMDYKLARSSVIEARHNLDHYKAAVDALEQKKRALTMLVELWIRNYYSEPKMTPHSQEAEQWNDERKEKEKLKNRTSGTRRRRQRESEERGRDD